MSVRKKLIEVALPLEVINKESAREKSIRHGHPSTLHLWWARRPLAACRAILFASLVDDPSSHPDRFPTEEAQNAERQRLFDLLGRIVTVEKKKKSEQVVRGLVSWDDIKDPTVVEAAQLEIARSLAWNRGEEPPTDPKEVQKYIVDHSPIVYDPFAGGGSIPIEAQRLGLKACASDLNPVAVLITKAMIEIPPKFAGQPPMNPEYRDRHNVIKELEKETWRGAKGLAEDIRYYGQWMREQAEKEIGWLYPKVRLHPHPPTPSPIKGEGEQERWDVPPKLKEKMKEVARQFRKEPTGSEGVLWQALRGRKLDGRKFRRQQPIGTFVVDFFCAEERLIVEVDGSVHDDQQEADQERQALLESLGLRFVRLSAEQVETNLLDSLNTIRAAFTPLALNGRGAGGEGEVSAKEATVIAWIWARTVTCPNPACGCEMPLVRSFALSTKKGNEHWIDPVIDQSQKPPQIRFEIRNSGKPSDGTVSRKGARCIACDSPVALEYVRSQGKAKRMSAKLMAIVAEGEKGRIYLPPSEEHEAIANSAQPKWKPGMSIVLCQR